MMHWPTRLVHWLQRTWARERPMNLAMHTRVHEEEIAELNARNEALLARLRANRIEIDVRKLEAREHRHS